MPLNVKMQHGETLHIGDDITIVNKGQPCKLEVNAPADTPVWRSGVEKTIPKGQTLSPEDQRRAALQKLRRSK